MIGMDEGALRRRARAHAVAPIPVDLKTPSEDRVHRLRDHCSQYFTIRGTTPSFGIGKELAGSEWKTLTEKRGNLVDLGVGAKVSSSTGDFRLRLVAATSSFGGSHGNLWASGEVEEMGVMGEVFNARSGGQVRCRLGVTLFLGTANSGRCLSNVDGVAEAGSTSCSILSVFAMPSVTTV